jgi:hypothetical protein
MIRSHGRKTMKVWLTQVVHIEEPHVTSAANLVLLIKQYFIQDKSIYSDWRMFHIRKKWMKQQLKLFRDKDGGLTCSICHKTGLLPHSPCKDKRASLDHIINISDGGEWNNPENFQVACQDCNENKNKVLQES